MSKCEKCGSEYKLSFRDKSLRRLVSFDAKMFPVLKQVTEEAENYCNECWKAAVKPVAEQMAGIKSIE